MKNIVRILAPSLVVFTILSLPASSFAEREYRFEFFGGVSLPVDQDFEIGSPQSDVIVQATHEFSPGGQGGVRFGIDGGKYWGQDYAYSYGANATKLVTEFGSFAFTNRFHQVSSNVLFYPGSLERKRFFPYLTAGVGATFVVLKQDLITESLTPSTGGLGPLKSETIFAFNAGGGVRFRLSDRIGIRLDARDYISRPLRYGLEKSSDDPNESVLPVSGVFHQIAGTIGVVIHF